MTNGMITFELFLFFSTAILAGIFVHLDVYGLATTMSLYAIFVAIQFGRQPK